MIRVVTLESWFDTTTRRIEDVPLNSACVRDLLPEWLRADDTLATRNGVRVSLDDVAEDGDIVCATRMPGNPAIVGQVLAYAFISLATYVVAKLLAPVPPTKDRGDEGSAFTGFSGIQNNRVEGLPMPVIYGRMRAGGQIVNEWVESRGPLLGSWYNALISFGEGPIQSICGRSADTDVDQPLRTGSPDFPIPAGLLINDLDARDLDDVTMHVRLGTTEQLPIPGFERTNETDATAFDLLGPATTDTSTLFYTVALTPTGADDAVWDEYGVVYTMPDEADSFTITITLPYGLYSNASAVPAQWSWTHAVRYIELDGGGAPITSGGNLGDGYVRLRREARIIAAVQGEFSMDFTYPLYDPQTFSLPALSKLIELHADATGAYQTAHAARVGGLVGFPSTSPTEFSVQAWAQLRPDIQWTGSSYVSQLGASSSSVISTGATAYNASENVILDWNDSNKGFRLSLCLRQFQATPGNFKYFIVPTLFVWDGTTVHTFWEKKGELGVPSFYVGIKQFSGLSDDNWNMFTATFARNVFVTDDRVRVYANGILLFEALGNYNVQLPAAGVGTFYLGRESGSTTSNPATFPVAAGDNGRSYFKGRLDEVVVWSRELTETNVRDAYQSGRGAIHVDDGSVVAGWHFDTEAASGNGVTVVDFSANGNNLTTAGTTDANELRVGLDDGIIENTAANDRKRGRYKIEVIRGLYDIDSNAVVDDAKLTAVTRHIEEDFSHPSSPLLAVRIKADGQLSGGKPKITALLEGRTVPVWDEASASEPTFTPTFSTNPAWIVADMILNTRYGLGSLFSPADLDVQAFKAWADYCDEYVYDLRVTNRVLVDGDGAAGRIANIQYSSAGELTVPFTSGTTIDMLPAGWVVGAYVAFSGLETPSTEPNIDVDINAPNIRGMRISSIFYAPPSPPSVLLEYDVATYGDPWPDGQTYQTQVGTSADVQGEAMIRRKRYEFNTGYDQQKGAWPTIVDACAIGHAAPIRVGQRVTVAVQNDRQPVDIVSAASIVRNSFEIEYLNGTDKPNAMDIEFLDADLDYERSTVSVEHPSIQDTADLSDVRKSSTFLVGVTDRAQAIRHGRFMLELNNRTRRRATFEAAIDTIALQPSDVVLVAHDLMPRGVSGRVVSASSSTSLELDRAWTLAGSTTYYLAVRSKSSDGYETLEVTSSAGSYDVGDTITVDTGYTFLPEKDDTFILYEDGTELPMQAVSLGTSRSFRRTIEAINYDPAVYQVDDATDLPELTSTITAEYADTGNAGRATGLKLTEATLADPVLAVTATWTNGEDDLDHTDVYVSLEGGVAQRLGRAEGTQATATVPISGAQAGMRVTVSVVPVTTAGVRRRPTAASLVLSGLSAAPAAPAVLSARMTGRQAVYSVADLADTEVVVRRGGWLLGMSVAVIPPGARGTPPTDDWVTTAGSGGLPDYATLYARARTRGGRYSTAVSFQFEPSIPAFGGVSDLGTDTYTLQEWSIFGIGWRKAAGTPNATLTDLQVLADGSMGFTGNALAATYTAAQPALAVGKRPEIFRVSAYVEAEQVHPLAWDDMSWTWNQASQWTWEGPLDSEDRCTLTIEFRSYDPATGWSDWSAYKPSDVRCLNVQFRLQVTRPSTQYDVRIRRFSTELRRLPKRALERTPIEALVEGRALRNG